MTVQLTTNVTQPNIARWRVVSFDLERGRVTLRFGSGGEAQWIDLDVVLSDVANQSWSVTINASATDWNRRIISTSPLPNGVGGAGAANSLTAARDAYRGAANHNAGLKAVELRALTDGWVAAALGGT